MSRLRSLYYRAQHRYASLLPSSHANNQQSIPAIRALLPYVAIILIILFSSISFLRSSTDFDPATTRSFTSSGSTVAYYTSTARQLGGPRSRSKRLERSWISVEAVLDLAHARLDALIGGGEERERLREAVGLKLGEVRLREYAAEMEELWNRWFVIPAKPVRKGWRTTEAATAKNEWVLDEVDRRLSLLPHDPDTSSGPGPGSSLSRDHPARGTSAGPPTPFAKTIYTTSAVSVEQDQSDSESTSRGTDIFPDQFHSWAELNPEWTVKFFDDEAIWTWMSAVFADGEVAAKENELELTTEVGSGSSDGGTVQAAPLLDEYATLSQGVLKADFFRYLILLMRGGIYTDTDTACVKPLDEWPGLRNDSNAEGKEEGLGYLTVSDGLLEFLPDLMKLAEPLKPRSGLPVPLTRGTGDGGDSSTTSEEETTGETPINLIVSIESAVQDYKSTSFVRGIQLVQWTIAARPGHPVLLDTLGRILETARQVRTGEIEDAPAVLEWTGPGVFSDAVFRYLLARWGVRPHQVTGKDHPIRVGDVLIMPVHSFRADASEGDQPEGKLVWHGFFGSWKGE